MIKEVNGLRLYNIYYLCKTAKRSIDEITFSDFNGSREFEINGWENGITALSLLREMEFIKDYADNAIKIIPVYVRSDANPRIDAVTKTNFNSVLNEIKIRLDSVVKLYESLEAGEAKEGIDIKIPKCNDLKEYIQYMKDIDFILSQCPFISGSGEEIVFNTVDVGSMWLSLFIKAAAGSHVIMSILSKMSEIATQFRSNKVVINQQKEILETMRQKNEVGQEMIDTFRRMKTLMLDDAVSQIEESSGIKLVNEEERDKARRAIDTFSELLDKGVELYSAIETPEDVKVKFPFAENDPLLSEEAVKLIEDKEEIED